MEQFNQCRKGDLFKKAEFFKIVVPHNASKKVKKVLHRELVMQQILPDESGMGGVDARDSITMQDD